jgi:hypothetical protein
MPGRGESPPTSLEQARPGRARERAREMHPSRALGAPLARMGAHPGRYSAASLA